MIKDTPKEIRIFAGGIAVICQFFAALSWWKGGTAYPYLSTFGLLFAAVGIPFPNLIKPIFRTWMIFAVAFGKFQTRLLLRIIFYFVITPIGLTLRIIGKDPLDKKLEPEADTYWKKREPMQDAERYTKQF